MKKTKNMFLSIFSGLVTMVCIILATCTFVFAYVPYMSLPTSITQTLSAKCYLRHQGVTLYSTDSNEEVDDENVGVGKTYQVKALADDLIQVKAKYEDLIENNVIVFTVTDNANATYSSSLKLDAINVYGVDLDLPNSYMDVALNPSRQTLTITFNSTLPIESEDIITCNLCVLSNTLPEGYTKLEYIQSTGTQYIDTGVIPNGKTLGLEFEWKITSTINDVWSGVNSYYSGDINCVQWGIYNKNYIMVMTSNSNKVYLYNIRDISLDAQWHTFKLNRYNVGQEIDGTNYGSYQAYNTCTQTMSIYLFARHWQLQGSSWSAQYSYQAYKYFKVYDGETLIQYLIPAQRNSDEEVGMYDTVTGTFYENQGSGDFVAGPEA